MNQGPTKKNIKKLKQAFKKNNVNDKPKYIKPVKQGTK